MKTPIKQQFVEMLTLPGAIARIFDRAEHDAAFFPYWPLMLDFELPENEAAEDDEIRTYWEAFNKVTGGGRVTHGKVQIKEH